MNKEYSCTTNSIIEALSSILPTVPFLILERMEMNIEIMKINSICLIQHTDVIS